MGHLEGADVELDIHHVRAADARGLVNLDLREFVQDALMRGTINPAWYLIDVEAGFEIWQGGSGLATRSFSAVVGGGGDQARLGAINSVRRRHAAPSTRRLAVIGAPS